MEAVMSNCKLVFLLLSLLTSFRLSLSSTLVVDGVSHLNNPTVQIGDSIIFRHKYKYNLYIFQNRRAFNLCNFTQSTLLTQPNQTSFTWHPSRLGFFYFSFNNGSTKACQDGQKLAIEVSSSIMPPQISASPPQPQPPAEPPQSPPPTLGGIVSSSPAYPWPFGPRESTAPSPSPSSQNFPATSPSMVGGVGGSIPFINSNPAVPLPTGEIDSATIRPVPTSSDRRVQVVGLQAVLRDVCCVVFMMLL